MVKGFSKIYNLSVFGPFFCKHIYYKTGVGQKIIFLQILKEEHKSFPMINDVSFVIFGHKTWDLEGGSN